MTRRIVLTAVELALTASALTAAVYGLVRAAYDPYAPVQWVPIAVVGAGTALSFVGLAAVLFVGRAALLLAADTVHARQAAVTPPPSASAPLWRPRTADEQAITAYAAPGTGRRGLPRTLPLPVEDLVAAGGKQAGAVN